MNFNSTYLHFYTLPFFVDTAFNFPSTTPKLFIRNKNSKLDEPQQKFKTKHKATIWISPRQKRNSARKAAHILETANAAKPSRPELQPAKP